jgi:hypothetical protein
VGGIVGILHSPVNHVSVIDTHVKETGERGERTILNPSIPKSLLALHTTWTRLGSTFTAPSGKKGSVRLKVLTNLGACEVVFRSVRANTSSQIKWRFRSWQNSMSSSRVFRG